MLIDVESYSFGDVNSQLDSLGRILPRDCMLGILKCWCSIDISMHKGRSSGSLLEAQSSIIIKYTAVVCKDAQKDASCTRSLNGKNNCTTFDFLF